MQRLYSLLSFAVAILLLAGNAQAQRMLPTRTCATHDAVFEHLKNNWNQRLGTISNISNQRDTGSYTVPTVNTDTTYTIPVVVHVVYLDDNKYENISDSLIQTQIDALNRDFNLENDTSIIRDELKQFVGNAKIRFELAKLDRYGRPTTGITRKKSRPVGVPDWNPVANNVKYNISGGQAPWPLDRYLNIWVCDLNMNSRICPTCVDICDTCGLLGGYAQPPKGLPQWVINLEGIVTDASAVYPANTDGVVIDFRFFGQKNHFNRDYLNNSDVYGFGKTTTHEVGHYLGLRHTWGDYGTLLGDGCVYDDGISDTPNEAAPYANFIEPGNICGNHVNTCTTPYPGDGVDYPDMLENYMNYSTDICYGMFTHEQINMMRYALLYKRANLINARQVIVNTGIKYLSAENNGIDLYPNPTKGLINVRQANTSSDDTQIQVFNIMGAVVQSIRIPAGTSTYTINMNGHAPAIYFVNFRTGNQSSTEKIVLQ